MNRKLPVILAALVLVLAGCAGNAEPEAPTETNLQPRQETGAAAQKEDRPYAQLLEQLYARIRSGEDLGEEPGMTGIREAAGWQEGGRGLQSIGWRADDLSGDGVPELIIGTIPQPGAEGGEEILALYHLEDGVPTLTLEGWARNSHFLMEDGHIFRRGSGGAMYSLFGVYELAQDGSGLNCLDFYFSWEKETDSREAVFLHNTTGVCDPQAAEETDLDSDGFRELELALQQLCGPLQLTPLSRLYTSGLRAEWLPDGDPGTAVQLDDGEFSTLIALTAEEKLWNLRLFSMAVQDVSEDGRLLYDEKICHIRPELEENEVLTVQLSFPGDLPGYGVSWQDANGVHTCAFAVSGEDGSLFLMDLEH